MSARELQQQVLVVMSTELDRRPREALGQQPAAALGEIVRPGRTTSACPPNKRALG
jgi:hypothetical protein